MNPTSHTRIKKVLISLLITIGLIVPEYDGIDPVYLRGKMQSVVNTATHITKYQLKK